MGPGPWQVGRGGGRRFWGGGWLGWWGGACGGAEGRAIHWVGGWDLGIGGLGSGWWVVGGEQGVGWGGGLGVGGQMGKGRGGVGKRGGRVEGWVFSVWAFCCHMWALHELHYIPNFTKIISKMI